MKLGELINWLKGQPRDKIVAWGICNPHSYRGYYEDLAFEPTPLTTIGDMLIAAESAVGATFTGWKGGDFTMYEDSECWMAGEGHTTDSPINEEDIERWAEGVI